MVLYQVHRQSQYIKYYSTICSRATLFQLIVLVVIILAPFFTAYATNELWQRTSTYIEQPKVHFLNQWIVQVTTEDSVKPRAWSTYHGLNRLLIGNMHLAVPTVKFREEDYSFDQIKDKLVLNIDYIDQSLNITAVDLVLFFELQLSLMADVTVHSAIHISSSCPRSSSSLWTAGDLLLYQRDPLPSSGRVTAYNRTFFNDSSITTSDYELTNILREVQARNVSTVLGNSYSMWRTGYSNSFSIEVELTYPKQTVLYTPGFWQVVKFAWVQYLALLVVFYYVFGCVQNFVFENQIVLTVRKKHKLS